MAKRLSNISPKNLSQPTGKPLSVLLADAYTGFSQRMDLQSANFGTATPTGTEVMQALLTSHCAAISHSGRTAIAAR
jgi:hypothetical protein